MILVLLSLVAAQPVAAAPQPMNGDWSVDLTASADDKPYRQPMRLDLKSDGTVVGSFYNSEIENGRWKTMRGRTCVSFRTSDGVGPYHSAACLTGATVTGQTWAEHRKFVFLWTADRVTPAP